MAKLRISRATARKVLETVDAGLVSGLGKPYPGKMCVEAAVCYALGLPHGDDPGCVSLAVRACKITLNDADWSSPAARAKGMRRLALIQLGTAGEIDEVAFAKAIAYVAASYAASDAAARAAASDAARAAASAASYAARAAASDASYAARAAAARAAASAARTAASYAASYAASDAASYAARAASYAASDASDAARAAASDAVLAAFAEDVVQILVKLGAKSASFLTLAPL